MKLHAPTAYKGGKTRMAPAILDQIELKKDSIFCDLCCGSGAVSMELINRGFPPEQIVMVEQGPFGLFWEMIGKGTFDLDRLYYYIAQIPDDPTKIKDCLKRLASSKVNEDVIYIFLILQAGSFGGNLIRIKGTKWVTDGYRGYWTPKPCSSSRSFIHPMQPQPFTMRERVKNIMEVCGEKLVFNKKGCYVSVLERSTVGRLREALADYGLTLKKGETP